MVLQRVLKIYKISGEVIKFIEHTVVNWRVEQKSRKNKFNRSENQERDVPVSCHSLTYLGNAQANRNFINHNKNHLLIVNGKHQIFA